MSHKIFVSCPHCGQRIEFGEALEASWFAMNYQERIFLFCPRSFPIEGSIQAYRTAYLLALNSIQKELYHDQKSFSPRSADGYNHLSNN